MYCLHSLHIFSNYIVNTVVCIYWIIADGLGAIQVCLGSLPAYCTVGQMGLHDGEMHDCMFNELKIMFCIRAISNYVSVVEAVGF